MQMLPSVAKQFDIVYIHFNQNELPNEIKNTEIKNIRASFGVDYADNGKFHFLYLCEKGDMYFTLDDDIIYPRDYVAQTLANLQAHKEKVVTYHGRKLTGKGKPYYSGHTAHLFSGRTVKDEIIDVPGTGCMAFEVTHYFKPDFLANDGRQKMADLIFAEYCAKVGKQIVACTKDYGWLKSLRPADGIQQEFMGKPTPIHDKLADKIYELNYGQVNN